ncbi:MAG: pilus assembly protein [Hyphomicrobiales bacterium]|nr:pilus assembly protein [Hyphomicrobiales bacterium]
MSIEGGMRRGVATLGEGTPPALARAKIRAGYRRLDDFVRDEDGAALVEFTVMLPLFMLVMFGILEWGNIFFTQNNMLIAARLGVRAAAVNPASNSSSNVIAAACGTSSSPTPITGTGYTYTFTYSYNQGCSGASSTAYGNVALTIATPAAAAAIVNYLGLIGSENLTATVTMQQEYVCPASSGAAAAVSQTC